MDAAEARRALGQTRARGRRSPSFAAPCRSDPPPAAPHLAAGLLAELLSRQDLRRASTPERLRAPLASPPARRRSCRVATPSPGWPERQSHHRRPVALHHGEARPSCGIHATGVARGRSFHPACCLAVVRAAGLARRRCQVDARCPARLSIQPASQVSIQAAAGSGECPYMAKTAIQVRVSVERRDATEPAPSRPARRQRVPAPLLLSGISTRRLHPPRRRLRRGSRRRPTSRRRRRRPRHLRRRQSPPPSPRRRSFKRRTQQLHNQGNTTPRAKQLARAEWAQRS